MRVFKLFLFILSFSISTSLYADNMPASMQAFIQEMVKNNQFDQKSLTELFEEVKYQPAIIKSITTPYEAQPWYKYQSHFLTKQRIEAGVAYWKANRQYLEAAEKRYHVDPAVIVGIIGVETNYGNLVGHYRVIDALSTLAFYYPPRSKFFTQELKEYLLMCRQQHISPLSIKGSYAGAFGIPQFMPSSSRRFAVAYDPKSIIDISNKHEDAIMSVANYFNNNHWQLHAPVASMVNIKGNRYQKLIESKVALDESVGQLGKNGVKATGKFSPELKASLIQLQGEKGPEYWMAFSNFKVIMSYNPRIAYAMAVYQLSAAVSEGIKQANE